MGSAVEVAHFRAGLRIFFYESYRWINRKFAETGSEWLVERPVVLVMDSAQLLVSLVVMMF